MKILSPILSPKIKICHHFGDKRSVSETPGKMGFDTPEGRLVYLDREDKAEASWGDANLINSQSKK